MKIIRDDDSGVAPALARPRRVFDVGAQRRHAGNVAQLRQRRGVAIDRIDGMAARREPARVAPAAARDVEHAAACRDFVRPPHYPRGRRFDCVVHRSLD